MKEYLSADIIYSDKRKVSGESSSRKTTSFEEQMMSADKYTSISFHQIEAIVYMSHSSKTSVYAEKIEMTSGD